MLSAYLHYDLSTILAITVALGSLAVMVGILLQPRPQPVNRRLERLATGLGLEGSGMRTDESSLKPQAWAAPTTSARRAQHQPESTGGLRERLMRAGLYSPKMHTTFYFVRGTLLIIPIASGYGFARAGFVKMPYGLVVGTAVGLIGTLAPSFWLDHLKHVRQVKLRRALPDALDVISVCLQGGLSLSVALTYVARELNMAHPELADELNIVERQIQLGSSAAEAIREMANRFDLDELRSMATVISQAEKIGSSVATALELFAESMRVRRHQQAEEQAHKASVKLLLPMILCIFPAVFVVILGPAVLRIYTQMIFPTGH